MSHMIILGLTGQTGAGKTTVSQYLQELGLAVIDADLVSRKVVEPGSSSLTEIALTFGCEVLQKDGSLNRKKLGSIVFADKMKLRKLNNIMGPSISREVKRQLEQYRQRGEKLVVFDAPTLFESGADKMCDRVVSVIAPLAKRKGRIIERDGISDEDATNRISVQQEDAFYVERSWYVLENDSDIASLKEKTRHMLEMLAQERYHPQNEETNSPKTQKQDAPSLPQEAEE